MPGDPAHFFLRYDEAKSQRADASAIASYVLSLFLGQRLSAGRLRKFSPLNITPSDGPEFQLRFEDLVDFIQEHQFIDTARFRMPDLECHWLDGATMIGKPDAPIPAIDQTTGRVVEFASFALPMPFGDGFPLAPSIDREGAAYRSLQTPLLEGILSGHQSVLEHSNRITAWELLNALRGLLNDCVAIVDVTLHQLYFMAKHRHQEMGWKFEPEKLGDRHGRRLADKLRWVGQITGRHLDDSRAERDAFTQLKDLRNHLTHFDPPCFAYTMEDMARWLNLVPSVGRLLWKMRDKMNAQLVNPLIRVILLPRVTFHPTQSDKERVPQPPSSGYGSTSWRDPPAPDSNSQWRIELRTRP